MVLRMKNVNILGVHWKIWLLEGGGSNIEGGDGLKREGAVCQFKGCLTSKRGVFLRGVDTPMHTTAASCNHTLGPAKVPECTPRLFGIECCF